MIRSSPPSIRQFLGVIYRDWTARMSGALTVPFPLLATLLPSDCLFEPGPSSHVVINYFLIFAFLARAADP
jgi:hypothetical protein